MNKSCPSPFAGSPGANLPAVPFLNSAMTSFSSRFHGIPNEEALFDDEYDDEPFSDIDDDWDEENESISLFYEMMYKSEEEKDEIIETGAFNAHIAGYLIYTLQQLGCSASTITKARQLFFDEIVPNITAETARELSEATELNKLDSILNKNNIIHFPTEDWFRSINVLK